MGTIPQHQVGPYRISRRIGRGSAGVIYEAQGPDKVPVAVKFLDLSDVDAPEERWEDLVQRYLERFFKEMVILSLLSRYTEAVPRYIDHGVAHGQRHYLVMELIKGVTLKEYLARPKRMGTPDTLRIVKGVLHALSAAHTFGIVHRDLKPSNILLDDKGQARVIDFGIARAFHGNTNLRFLVGNLQHMSPEQTRGEAATPASDIWSLGSILYEMLVGRTLYKGSSVREYLEARRSTPVPTEPPESCAHIEASTWNIVTRALTANPPERPTAPDMLGLIEQELRILAVNRTSLSTSSVISLDTTRPANQIDDRLDQTLLTQFTQ